LDIEKYKNYVPLIKESKILKNINPNTLEAELTIDYLIGETSYVSLVTFSENKFVKVNFTS
jgi:ribosome-associated toxin RatA of RatAB toxin-antitoxin module